MLLFARGRHQDKDQGFILSVFEGRRDQDLGLEDCVNGSK